MLPLDVVLHLVGKAPDLATEVHQVANKGSSLPHIGGLGGLVPEKDRICAGEQPLCQSAHRFGRHL